MKTLKVMAIIGIVISSFCFLGMIASFGSDYDEGIASGWGFLTTLYSLPFSIVALVISLNGEKKSQVNIDNLQLITQLAELKEKNLLTEEEYSLQKRVLLNS